MQVKSGILLAGGNGTRLAPLTGAAGFNKHMLPIHNKFIIDYSLQTLIDIGCKNINVILGGEHAEQVVRYQKSCVENPCLEALCAQAGDEYAVVFLLIIFTKYLAASLQVCYI